MRTEVARRRGEQPVERGAGLLSPDARTAVGIGLACFALLVVLRIVSARGESAERGAVRGIPTPVVSASQGCANFANYWMVESGVGVDAATIEAISNCRLSSDGLWFVPTGSRDTRLRGAPYLTTEERAATDPERQELLSDLAALEDQFPRALEQWLEQIYDPVARPVRGHLTDNWRRPIGSARNRYTRLVQAYLMAPERERLAAYVGWVMARRIDAYAAFRGACLSKPELAYLYAACLGVEDTLSIRFPPFLWDLRDPLLLDQYLASTLMGGGDDQSDASPAAVS